MKKLIFIPLLFLSCAKDLSKSAAEEITETDKAMCQRAAVIGFNPALLEYADEDFIKLNNFSLPVIGKAAFEKTFAEFNPKTVSWEPVKAEASKAGDLGYTWGNWKYVSDDTTYYGNYFTVWKKDKDGKWKVKLDGGTDGKPAH